MAAKDGETLAVREAEHPIEIFARAYGLVVGDDNAPFSSTASSKPTSSRPTSMPRERAERRKALIPIKRRRRVEVGPYATFYFENYDTMLAQVQEMLHIEKGGKEQIAGELEAYNPLIPQGAELIATLMLEIDEPNRRTATLLKLAGIEESAYLQIGAEKIEGTPTEYEDRTTEDGKTSSVHWVRFRPFSAKAQIAAFHETWRCPAECARNWQGFRLLAVSPTPHEWIRIH